VNALSEAAEIIGVVRDVAIISILLVAMAILVFVLWKLSAFLNSARRTMKNAEEITAAVSDRIVGPAAAGSGVAFGAGKLAAFVLGWSKGKKRQGGEDDG
jgi:uncharacterized membrane protein (Fun14 family)